MKNADRPRFRVAADRLAATRRVRYVETNRPDNQKCAICQLDQEDLSPADETAPASLDWIDRTADSASERR